MENKSHDDLVTLCREQVAMIDTLTREKLAAEARAFEVAEGCKAEVAALYDHIRRVTGQAAEPVSATPMMYADTLGGAVVEVSAVPQKKAQVAPNDWLVQNLMRTLFKVRGYAEEVYIGVQREAWQKADFSNSVSLDWPGEDYTPTTTDWIAVHVAANDLLRNYRPNQMQATLSDRLPSLPEKAGDLMQKGVLTFVAVDGYTANQMREYGAVCHALGRGAAVREYVQSGSFAAPLNPLPAEQGAAPVMTVDSPDFRSLPQIRILNTGSFEKLVAHIDAHTAAAVKAEAARCNAIMVEKLRHGPTEIAAKQAEIDRLTFELHEATDSLVAQMAAPQQPAQAAQPVKQYGLAAYAQANADSRVTWNAQATLSTEQITHMWQAAQDQAISGRPAPFHFYDAIMAATRKPAPDTCRVDQFSSRGCELGTKGCIIHHDAPVAAAAQGEASSDPIVEMNVAMLRQRSAVGVTKYGVTMADAGIDHRAWLAHALEEGLDQVNYLQAAIQKLNNQGG